MSPAGSYEMPVKYFLQSNEYDIQTVDASKTEYFRMIRNGGGSPPESGLTRLLGQLKRNATMILNIIASDLAAVFPEYTEIFEIDSKV